MIDDTGGLVEWCELLLRKACVCITYICVCIGLGPNPVPYPKAGQPDETKLRIATHIISSHQCAHPASSFLHQAPVQIA